jgi:hypothetical protein
MVALAGCPNEGGASLSTRNLTLTPGLTLDRASRRAEQCRDTSVRCARAPKPIASAAATAQRPLGFARDTVPGDVLVDRELELPIGLDFDCDDARRRRGINFDGIGENAKLLKSTKEFASWLIAADARHDPRLRAKRAGVVGEVRRRAAQLPPPGRRSHKISPMPTTLKFTTPPLLHGPRRQDSSSR